jgi:rare lipoprotein A
MKIMLFAVFLHFAGGDSLLAQSAADSIRKIHAKAVVPNVQTGVASYYHPKFNGRLTASGEPYDQTKMTAAHSRLPLGTRIKVTNLRNKRSVVVKVNDRLHHRNTRLVDLSKAAAAALGYVGRGLTKVKVEVLRD